MRLENLLNLTVNEGIEDKGIFKACFLSGSSGSGKSYVLSKIKSGSVEPRIVNTDKAFSLFGAEKWGEGWIEIKDTVKKISKNQLSLYINSMLPLAVDGTSSSTSLILRRVGILESFGYDASMIFINTSLETAMLRASKRERPVDPEFIEKAYIEVEKAKSFYKSKFRIWIEVDNDEGQLTDKVILRSFKFMSSFYSSPVKNPIGTEIINKMKENGWKYLSPHIKDIENIKKIVDGWYNF
uniref:Putative ATPase domain containing protein n=1 Tax=viral metagenome TaxID=1070528 RepID=A0A6M3K116_9ZZZZ